MWFLIVAFAIWGAGSAATTSRNYAGTIFDKKISPQEYGRSYSAVVNRAKMLYGDQLAKMQKFLNLEGQAWDRLILLHYAKKQGIKVSNKEVIDKVASMPFFQTEGAFDEKSYKNIVQYAFGTTPREFEESVRGDIVISKIVDSAEKDISITDEEVKGSYRFKNEKADISYILIESDSFKEGVALEERELEPFYNSHKERFIAPEKRSVYYVKMPFPEIGADEEKADGKEAEEGELDEERREAEEKKREAKGQAQDINGRLNAGEDFGASAKRYNLGVNETDLFAFGSTVSDIGLSYPFSIAAFTLSEERANNIVEEKDAFYVIKLKEKVVSRTPPFKEIKEDVRSALITHKADGLAKAAAQNYVNILKAKEDTLKNLSKITKTSISSHEDIARGDYVEGVGVNAEFNNACFSIEEKEFTGPIKVQKGYCIIRLDELKPIDEEKFEEEKEEFKEELLERKKRGAFQDWFAVLKEKAGLKTNF